MNIISPESNDFFIITFPLLDDDESMKVNQTTTLESLFELSCREVHPLFPSVTMQMQPPPDLCSFVRSFALSKDPSLSNWWVKWGRFLLWNKRSRRRRRTGWPDLATSLRGSKVGGRKRTDAAYICQNPTNSALLKHFKIAVEEAFQRNWLRFTLLHLTLVLFDLKVK